MNIYFLTLKYDKDIPFIKVKAKDVEIIHLDENMVKGKIKKGDNDIIHYAAIKKNSRNLFVFYHFVEGKEEDENLSDEELLELNKDEFYQKVLKEIKGKCDCEKIVEILKERVENAAL